MDVRLRELYLLFRCYEVSVIIIVFLINCAVWFCRELRCIYDYIQVHCSFVLLRIVTSFARLGTCKIKNDSYRLRIEVTNLKIL